MALNYLFVKELYEVGDKVLVIAQKKLEGLVKHFAGLFPYANMVESIVLRKDGDEDLWDTICRTVRGQLPSDGLPYFVNLSGGTRLLSIAVQQVLERQNAMFFFMPLDRNVIIQSHIDNNNDIDDDILCEIAHQMTIEEYLRVNNVICSHKQPLLPKEYTQDFFAIFTGNHLSGNDYDILEELRQERNDTVSVNDISGLRKFLEFINFPMQNPEKLSSKEIQYLTGNWFEEYIYYAIQQVLTPTDIAIGVDIQRKGSKNHNDLDVVFTYKNRLFAIECKTGVGKVSLYNQIVYKACALKEALLGMRCNSYIFSLNDDHKDNLARTAKNMGITFCDRHYALQPTKLKNLFQNPTMWQ